MTQQYYYSSLTGPQLDAALGQISQAAEAAVAAQQAAAAAVTSAEDAKQHALAAEAAASQAGGYTKTESDARFAPAIVLTAEGSAVKLPWAAPLPPAALTLFGSSVRPGEPAPDAPLPLPENPCPRLILAGQNLWDNGRAVIESGGSCWTATDTGFTFTRGDYTGTGCLYVPVPIPRGQTLYFRCSTAGDFITCSLYGDGIHENRLASGIKGRYSFTADRDYPNAVAAIVLGSATGDVDISNIHMGFEDAAFTPGKPLRILETGLPLYGIPMQSVCAKHNFTDASGQKWFADEIDFARGVYIQRCFTLTFDGTENWSLSSAGEPGINTAQLPALKDFDAGANAPDSGKCVYMLCSHFQTVPRSIGEKPSSYADSAVGANGNFIRFKWDQYKNDLDGWKAWLAQQAAAGTPVTMLLGRRASAITETPLSAEVLEQFRTVIPEGEDLLYPDASAVLRLSYVADTGRYLEAKLAQLSNAILN